MTKHGKMPLIGEALSLLAAFCIMMKNDNP
jgi:hypothetical protein